MTRILSAFSIAGLSAPAAFAASSAEDSNAFWGGFAYSFTDPVTITAFGALLAFFAIVWRVGGFKTITTALDDRAAAIEKELNDARDLRERATKALADAEQRQKDADEEAKAIVAQAKADAKDMMAQARKDLDDRLKRREALAEARITRAEAEAADDVRRAAADAATCAARSILSEESGADQFDKAADDIEKALS